MKLIRRERLGEQLFELLRRNILSGRIPVGRRLSKGSSQPRRGSAACLCAMR